MMGCLDKWKATALMSATMVVLLATLSAAHAAFAIQRRDRLRHQTSFAKTEPGKFWGQSLGIFPEEIQKNIRTAYLGTRIGFAFGLSRYSSLWAAFTTADFKICLKIKCFLQP